MKWWYGIAASDLFYSFVAAISSRMTDRQVFFLTLGIMPVTFGLDYWYNDSMALANHMQVSFTFVAMFNIVLGIGVSFILGLVLLRQSVSWKDFLGAAVIVIGILIFKS